MHALQQPSSPAKTGRMTRRLLCLPAAVLLTLLVASSALAATPEPRIVNGTEAAQGEYPAQGFLGINIDAGPQIESFCGGTLVGSRQFLTAAHCTTTTLGIPRPPSSFNVRLGAVDLQLRPPAHEYRGHGQRRQRPRHQRDIPERLGHADARPRGELRADARRHPTARDALWAPGTIARIIGWGTTSEGGELARTSCSRPTVPIRHGPALRRRLRRSSSIADVMVCAADADRLAAGELARHLPGRLGRPAARAGRGLVRPRRARLVGQRLQPARTSRCLHARRPPGSTPGSVAASTRSTSRSPRARPAPASRCRSRRPRLRAPATRGTSTTMARSTRRGRRSACLSRPGRVRGGDAVTDPEGQPAEQRRELTWPRALRRRPLRRRHRLRRRPSRRGRRPSSRRSWPPAGRRSTAAAVQPAHQLRRHRAARHRRDRGLPPQPQDRLREGGSPPRRLAARERKTTKTGRRLLRRSESKRLRVKVQSAWAPCPAV